jgi:hypothetical protein
MLSLPWGPGARTPTQSGQIKTAPSVEAHSLPLEPEALQVLEVAAAWTPADLSRSVHDAMPRDPTVLVQGAERIADEPSLARQSRQARDLAVGSNATPRDP